MIIRKLILSFAAASLVLMGACAAQAKADKDAPETATVHNPMMWADAPDPDVIRVGDDFYMVTTTMHLMPGAPVMHSRDLVNWETIGYVFDRLEDSPSYDLEGGTVYGRGQWATSLKYHDGKFYALFSPNDQPFKSYIYRAERPDGKWELLGRTDHFHDSSLLFDDDGKVYVFYNGGPIKVRELNPDLSGVKPGGLDKVVIMPDSTETGIHEGSRVIKHDGKYYAFVISWPAGKGRRQLCYRADNVEGPYEKMVVLESDPQGFNGVGQGCLVDDPDGNWWGVIFQDRNAVGRILTLNPCRWEDGWPMLGDSLRHVPAEFEKKVYVSDKNAVAESDDFSEGKKSILWQWNHNPVDSAWSLDAREGYLRLTTPRVVPNLFMAPNTISQRMTGPKSEAAVKMDIANMKPGDVAGFAAFNGDTGALSVVCDDEGKKWLTVTEESMQLGKQHEVTGVDVRETGRVALAGEDIWLKIKGDFTPGQDMATFFYSTDGKDWKELGKPFKMTYDYRRFFMGSRFAIFNYATRTPGGWIDVDSFQIL